MQSRNNQKLYSLRADANALGGYLEEPVAKTLPTLAPVSLPPVGGFATARSEAFTLDEIVSCSSAYTRVSGLENPDGTSSILVAAVVEDLNILEVVRAERVVMQLALSFPSQPGPIGISVAGSVFEGLRLAGQKCYASLNADLQNREGDVYQWALKRASQPSAAVRVVRSSLVDSLELSGAGPRPGHWLEIPEFGRIILGELLVSPDSVQLVGIRAELGCPVCGRISSNAVGGGGARDN
jgi:hypothetical protein